MEACSGGTGTGHAVIKAMERDRGASDQDAEDALQSSQGHDVGGHTTSRILTRAVGK